MAIRIRTVDGELVALCAAEHKAQEGDVYLGDDIHHALTVKFETDFRSMGMLKEEEKK